MTFSKLCIGLVGPLPPPFGGMANQTRQLAELLAGEGLTVEILQVKQPLSPSLGGALPLGAGGLSPAPLPEGSLAIGRAL